MLSLFDLPVFLLDLGPLDLRVLQRLGLVRVLLAEERAEADQVVLDQNVLLSQLFLTHTAALLLPKINMQRVCQLQHDYHQHNDDSI